MRNALTMLVLLVALCPTAAFAQGRRGGFGGGGAGGAGRGRGGPVLMDERTVLDLFTAILSLNDSQQQQLRTAFDVSVAAAAPVATQLASAKQAVIEAVKTGKSEDQIKALSGQEGSLSAQMLILQAQTFWKMWAILNMDQKGQVDDLMYDDIGEFLANAKPQASPAPAAQPTPGGR